MFPYLSSNKVLSADDQQERLKMSSWIVGFVDGEGCFSVSIFKNRTSKMGFQVMPEFVVTQGQKSVDVLYAMKDFFGCGSVFVNRRYDNHKENLYRFCVRSLKDLHEKIIPFFKENNLKTYKKNDFELFCEVVEMMIHRKHLTGEGLEAIRQLKNPQRLHAEP
jgi:hypothetical protein